MEEYLTDRIQMWKDRLGIYQNTLEYVEKPDRRNIKYYREQISILEIIICELELVQKVLQGEPNASESKN